jgi:hypothetical protein
MLGGSSYGGAFPTSSIGRPIDKVGKLRHMSSQPTLISN